jgi:hypothetical protein
MNILLIHHKRPKNLYRQLKSINSYHNKDSINILIWINLDSYDQLLRFFIKIINKFDLNIKFILPHNYINTASDSITTAIDNFFDLYSNGLIFEDDCLFENTLFDLHISALNVITHKSFVLCYSYFGNIYDDPEIRKFHHFICWGWYCNRDLWFEFKQYKLRYKLNIYFNFFIYFGLLAFFYWTLIYYVNKINRFKSWDYDFYFFLMCNIKKSPILFINRNLVSNIGADGLGARIKLNDNKIIFNKINYTAIHNLKYNNMTDYDYDILLENKFYSNLFLKRLPKYLIIYFCKLFKLQ